MGHEGGSGTAAARPSLLLIFTITVSGITVNTLVTPGIPDILDGLGVSRSLAGVFVGAATLPGIVMAPVIGVLADRHGRRRVLVPCMVVFAVSGGLAGLSPSFPFLVAMRFLQGAGSAGLINLAIVIIGDHWSGTRRAATIGRNSAVLTVCLAVFPTIGGTLTDLGGWRAPFAVYPLALVSAAVLYRRLPASPRREASFGDLVREAIPYLRTRTMTGVLSASVVVFALLFGLVLTVLPLYVEQQFGLAATWRGVILGLPAVTSTFAAATLGRSTLRFGRRRLLAGAALVYGAALAVVAIAPHLGLVVVGVLLLGLGEGTTIPSFQDMAAGAAPDESRGAVVASTVSAARVGQTVGPVAAGAAYGAAGAGPTFLGAAVIAVVVLWPLTRVATRRP